MISIHYPFFKEFFRVFEDDLLALGFKAGNGYHNLGEYYHNLDELAKVILIPSLPKELQMLL